MTLMLITVTVALAAVAIALGGTWYAWRDYRRHPERYGYLPGDRQRMLTTPERGVTREPAHRWSSSAHTSAPSARSPRVRTP